MVKWVWDIDERKCINISAMDMLVIHKLEQDEKYTLYASLKGKEEVIIPIVRSSNIGILKDKIRTIIAEG